MAAPPRAFRSASSIDFDPLTRRSCGLRAGSGSKTAQLAPRAPAQNRNQQIVCRRRLSALVPVHSKPASLLSARFGHSRGWLWRSFRIEVCPQSGDPAGRLAGGLNCQSVRIVVESPTRPSPLANRIPTSQFELFLVPLLDPCSASIARRSTGVLSDALWPRPLHESRARARALTPARLTLLVFMRFAVGNGPAGRLRSAKDHECALLHRRRWRRETGEAQRSSREAA